MTATIEATATYTFGIDVTTKDKAKLMCRLRRLKSTCLVSDGGKYREDPAFSQVYVNTEKDSLELDEWLYRIKGIETIGYWRTA